MFENQTLVTRSQAAAMLACSVDTVDRLCADGTLRKRHIRDYMNPENGRTYSGVPRILKADVEALIAKRFGLRVWKGEIAT